MDDDSLTDEEEERDIQVWNDEENMQRWVSIVESPEKTAMHTSEGVYR